MVGYPTPTGLNLQTSQSAERFQGQRQRPSALPGSCQSTSAGTVSIPCRRIFLAHSCPILIVQVHAASVIKLSSRTVAVIHKSHLAKRSRRTGVRGQWVGQRRTLWKFDSFPKLAPASFGHLYPRWPGRSFSSRGPAPSEVVMRLGSSSCSLRACVQPLYALFPPPPNLPPPPVRRANH